MAVAVLMGLGAAAPVAIQTDTTDRPPSCVHELTYESFAGLILVSVTIGGSPPLDFVLDSGATQSAINDPFLAQALGFEAREAGFARGVGSGAKRVVIADDIGIDCDGVEVLRAALVVHDIGRQLAELAGREIDGFLGAELFERYVVEINPVGHHLVLHDPLTFVYSGDGEVLPLDLEDRRPMVEAKVVIREGDKPVPVRLLVDSGSSRFMSLITRSRRGLKPPPGLSVSGSIGVVGETMVAVGLVRRFQIGSVVVENVETAWVEPHEVPAVRNIPDLNGIIGNQLLSRFRVFFDYRHGTIIIERPSNSSDTVAGDSR
jgi:hypothetical protein